MHRWRLAGVLVVLVSLCAALFAEPATALGDSPTFSLQSAAPPIAAIWSSTDGSIDHGKADYTWLWGPAIRAESKAPYLNSPGNERSVYYFDKARMEINHPSADPNSPWYVTSGLLVREMISGQVQVGDNTYVQASPAQVPITGDMENNPLSPTYATLAPLASIGAAIPSRRAPSKVGQPITALLHADGTVASDGVPGSSVHVGSYDSHLGHNLPDVFSDWMRSLPKSWVYVTGYPLTEPYWVNTIVGGKQKQVLVQAFERRVLTYTPDNPAGWQVETGNAGLHYRLWRGLKTPSDPKLTRLAEGVPLGELIVDQATSHGLDPYLFAALATMPNGGQGLFGLRLDASETAQAAHPLDPKVNAQLAAAQLASLRKLSSDWRAVLAIYYTGSGNPNWSDQGLKDFVSNVLNTEGKLISDFTAPPPKPKADPPPAPKPAPQPATHLVGIGAAAYYAPSYTVAWWNYTLQRYAAWGDIVPHWSLDPNGYYCVNPDFKPGQRLQLTANGVTLWCTIGDEVNAGDVASWRAKWVVELSYNTFIALHLDQNNHVEVRAP